MLRILSGSVFDDDLIKFLYILANQGRRVIISGLDLNYFSKTFDLFAYFN